MAKNRNNNLTRGTSGRVGDLVFSQRNGKTIIGRVGDRPSTVSPGQAAVRLRFQLASQYATAMMNDPAKKQLYESISRDGQSAFQAALTDFLKPPQIVEIKSSGYNGSIGSTVAARVIDKGTLVSVHIRIEKANGTLVEEGLAAAPTDGVSWVYTATVANANLSGCKIIVTAKDLPDNESIQQKTM